ncbi:hypothetical protein BTA51_12040 [Hahella sp. CCB-MM4]|uniref:PA2778 family cysteine peptidase n=1 Tax=Hahella sp. (strain CCB-MM4) TaxID=1926491 RepID=UPI000BC82770|nr:PA2778 family cysteine peptidase [Hahella sp. CCB-MM4]OZG73206.1 hypothetical protein BTA51_12040 [Hahella sp. CCB-MM4]
MAVELSDTPFFPQTKYHCGPASLATMLNSSGADTRPEQLTKYVYVPDRQGSFQLEMTATARSFGRVVYPLKPDMKNILLELSAGHPVLVLQNLGLSWTPAWHYAVVIGYDLEAAEIILRSGTEFRQTMNFGTFERSWSYPQPWAVVVLTAENTPATADVPGYVKSLEDLVVTDQLEAAQKGYEAARIRWPQAALIQFGQGNLAYQQQQYEQAVESFSSLVNQHPDNPQGWNNLSYAMAQRGCPQAIRAAACALAIAGKNEQQDMLTQFSSTSIEVRSILSNYPEENPQNCPQLPKCPL